MTFSCRALSTIVATIVATALTIATPIAWSQDAAAGDRSRDESRGSSTYAAQCSLCHGSALEGGQGPALKGLAGRKAAATDFGYSEALRRTGWTWDAARLDRYLADPQRSVPGTTMAVHVSDASERRALVAWLMASKDDPADDADRRAATSMRASVFGGWRDDAPGKRHRIAVADLPAPYASKSASNSSRIAPRPAGALPKVPAGFRVSIFADGLQQPRRIAVAPDGTVFVSETDAGRVRALRPSADGTRAESNAVFASGLDEPFGLAFHPASAPRWVYVAETNRVVRYPWRAAMTKADASAEVVIARISPTSGGHSNRDLAVAPDGRRMFVGVGSASNVAESIGRKSASDVKAFERDHGFGAAWGPEEGRALVLAFTPDGRDTRPFATGIRNCSGIAVHPRTNEVWCSTNERDRLGDDLVPDYVTRVREGGFYGWPWWYIGDHEDPRLAGERLDLRGKVVVPDVLLQPHSASLGIVFDDGARVPAAWRGSAFAAEHGSWNRANRTGPKLIRIVMNADGSPTGEYEDVMTGFVIDDAGDDRRVWGRPVGVAIARDGSILVSDDAGGVIWRIAYEGT